MLKVIVTLRWWLKIHLASGNQLIINSRCQPGHVCSVAFSKAKKVWRGLPPPNGNRSLILIQYASATIHSRSSDALKHQSHILGGRLIDTRPGQKCVLSKWWTWRKGGRKKELVITEHNAGLSVTLARVMNGGSPTHDIQAGPSTFVGNREVRGN